MATGQKSAAGGIVTPDELRKVQDQRDSAAAREAMEKMRRAEDEQQQLQDAFMKRKIGPEAIEIAGSHEDLAELGIEPAVEVRRVDALIRAAIGTSAGIRLVPADAELTDGVGALLRWGGA